MLRKEKIWVSLEKHEHIEGEKLDGRLLIEGAA